MLADTGPAAAHGVRCLLQHRHRQRCLVVIHEEDGFLLSIAAPRAAIVTPESV